MKSLHKYLLPALLASVFLLLPACAPAPAAPTTTAPIPTTAAPTPMAAAPLTLAAGCGLTWEEGIATGADHFSCNDPTLAQIDEHGAITAAFTPGLVQLQALNAKGQLLAWAALEILPDDTTVTFDTSRCTLTRSATLQLTPTLSAETPHPLTWTSSAPNVAEVSADGTVTALRYGTTTITAAHPNGSAASVTITVIPPYESLSFPHALYKLRPGATRQLPLETAPLRGEEPLLWSTSDPGVATVSADGTITGVSYGYATITATGSYSGVSASCQIKVCNAQYVAITFDDGPSIHTPQLLDYLRSKDIPATFFLVGERIPEYSYIVKQAAADGHELGYHSYDHTLQYDITLNQVVATYYHSLSLLREAAGRDFTLWRTPGGGYDQSILNCLPLPHVMWQVDTLDWKLLDAQKVYENILNYTANGGIILLHDLYPTSVEGAIRAMELMHNGDYEFMTVTELLTYFGTPPQNHTSYAMARQP